MKCITPITPTYPMNQITADLIMNTEPPTLYSIMNSMANYDREEKIKIRDLASATRERIFDFPYPLSSKVNKEEFECQILNHYIMRRIGFETFTAFQIYLENKLNEILPYYNIMFDSLADYNLFNDGETITRSKTDNGTSGTKTKFSQYPLNQLDDIDSGSYVSTQTTSDGEAITETHETENRTSLDKMDLYLKYLQTKNSIMTMIYKELDILFYGLVD